MQVHTVVMYVIMLLCLFFTYVTSDTVGSPPRVYELLTQAAELHPSVQDSLSAGSRARLVEL
jgi:Na+/proline symporter